MLGGVQSWGGYVGRMAQWREALISIFHRFSTGVGDISGLGGGLGARL